MLFRSSGSAASRHCAFQLGIIETLEEAVASEPFINAIAFSVCLMRVKDGTDIDELKAEIRRSANPAKWMAAANDTFELVNFFEATNTSYEVNAQA